MPNTILNNHYDELYHIDIKKSIRTQQDYLNLLQRLQSGYQNWRDHQNVIALRSKGMSLEEIATMYGVSVQRVYQLINKPSSLIISDGPTLLAPGVHRPTASIDPSDTLEGDSHEDINGKGSEKYKKKIEGIKKHPL